MGSLTIDEEELGKSILNLSEVLRTFEIESALYNIRLPNGGEEITVILTKKKVEVDGETKLIVMIRDVSDKIRLQEE